MRVLLVLPKCRIALHITFPLSSACLICQHLRSGAFLSVFLLKNPNFLLWQALIILFPGLSKFHLEPSPQTVPAGGAARFECQIEGIPTPVITWEKDKLAVPEENRWDIYVLSLPFCLLFFIQYVNRCIIRFQPNPLRTCSILVFSVHNFFTW